NIEQKKRKRKILLAQIRNDKKQLKKALREREKAVERLQKIIAELERERKRRMEEARKRKIPIARRDVESPFPNYRGRLIWPAEGKVISRFGKQRHPKLKTITENSGIDIKAEPGSDVMAVMEGKVTTITWIRGFGNTIIIDHGAGFYTVYTHVSNIMVNPGDFVLEGDVIARVGDSGSLEGPMLHFEIWENRTKHDPEKWLKR
ncbi:MAG: murein hydrolase activator EnvC family protein, partial [Fidelibacterota bacterium]